MAGEFHKLDYNYLRPSPGQLTRKINDTNPDPQYPLNPYQIFYETPLSHDERFKLKQLQGKLIISEKVRLPEYWSDGDSLRFLTMNSFQPEKAAKMIVKNLEWLASLANFSLTQEAVNLLIDGNVYTCGRDVNGYPVVIVKFRDETKMHRNMRDHYLNALTFVLMVCKKYMMLPRYCEKFVMIFDLPSNWNILKITAFFSIYWGPILALLNTNFLGMVLYTIIYNPSKYFLANLKGWGLLHFNKIQHHIILESEKNRFDMFIDRLGRETFYNGDLGPFDVYWPPEIDYENQDDF
jgi:hypothetical protein